MRKQFSCYSIRTLMLLSFCVALVCSIVATANAAIVQWTSGTGANMHYYQWVEVDGGLTWTQAEDAAEALTDNGLSWQLATITSAEEQTFIESFVVIDAEYAGWLGGEQTGSPATPADGWTWVTPETWSYTNWYAETGGRAEPNDWEAGGGEDGSPIEDGDEDHLAMWRLDSSMTYPGLDAHWLDSAPNALTLAFAPDSVGYFAEAVPIPGAVWLLGSGLIGIVGIRRKLKK